LEEQKTIGIVAKNSLSYIEEIFSRYQKNHVVVLLRDVNDSRVELADVSEVIEPSDSKGWFVGGFNFSCDDSLAQISFTSGTEGEPKGVLLTHRALSDTTERLNNIMEIDSTIREYVGVPAHFSFGLGRFRAIAAVGGRSYLPEHGFNPVEIKSMLQANEINSVSAVPSLWRVLLKNKSIFGDEALCLKWIEIGSQYMSRWEKEELKALFPQAKITQHYGLTEASRTTFLRIDQVTGEALESVGKSSGETEVKVSESGRICIRGPHVAETLLKTGKYISNIDNDGWFVTSDLGYMEGGYLYYQGRADDLINCGGVKLSPAALERDICESLGVKEGIAVSCIADELMGDGVLVASLHSLGVDQKEIIGTALAVLNDRGVNNKNILKTIVLDAFPVTETGKIQRKELVKLYDEITGELGRDADIIQEIDGRGLTQEEKKIQSIWQKALKVRYLDVDSNFYDLGGDSLTVISALIEMERAGVPADISKGMLQGFTIREIAEELIFADNTKEKKTHQIKTSELRFSMSVNVIRGIMVLFVILAHWYQGLVERIAIEYLPTVQAVLQPFFSMGTPGFAIIYGIGAGYSLYPIYLTDRLRFKNILKKTFAFLLWGITCLALVRMLNNYLVLEDVSFTVVTNTFYSVLAYYLLITATLYFWFKFISAAKHVVAFCFVLAISMYSLHLLVISDLAVYKTEGMIELIKLLLTAKYAYFLMLSGTLTGIAMGIYSYNLLKKKESFDVFYYIGLACIFLGIIMSIHAGNFEEWLEPVSTNHVWRWMTYFGVILVLLAALESFFIRYEKYGKSKKFIFQFFSVIGVLAFPLFVLHEMVIPFKGILLAISGHESLSLVVPVFVFLGVALLMFRKVHKFSFL